MDNRLIQHPESHHDVDSDFETLLTRLNVKYWSVSPRVRVAATSRRACATSARSRTMTASRSSSRFVYHHGPSIRSFTSLGRSGQTTRWRLLHTCDCCVLET